MLPYTGHNVKAAHVMSYLALLAKYCVGEAVVCYGPRFTRPAGLQ